MKVFLKRIVIFIIVFYMFSLFAMAHPGRTDSNGGHWDRKAGTYHYHSGEHASKEQPSFSSEDSNLQKESNEKDVLITLPKSKASQEKPKNNFTAEDFAFCIFVLSVVCIAFFSFYPLFDIFISLFKKLQDYFYREKPERLNLKDYVAYKKNARIFIKDFSNLILKYENESQEEYFSFAPSCCSEMKKMMSDRLSKFRAECSKLNFNEIDYEKMLHAHLSSVSFDLLASGEFHIYYGELDPMSCAFNLKRIHSKAINYALENKYITEEEAKEDSRALSWAIRHVG